MRVSQRLVDLRSSVFTTTGGRFEGRGLATPLPFSFPVAGMLGKKRNVLATVARQWIQGQPVVQLAQVKGGWFAQSAGDAIHVSEDF
jgi:hypothetical protein